MSEVGYSQDEAILVVIPYNKMAHQSYKFKIQKTGYPCADFLSEFYYFEVGCTATNIAFIEPSDFISYHEVITGSSRSAAVTLQSPTTNRTYCQEPTSHEIVDAKYENVTNSNAAVIST